MSLLTQNLMPAEIRRGGVFGERFHSAVDVVKNGGTISGTPTFSVDEGMSLDGINDRAVFSLSGNELSSQTRSVLIEIKPDQDYTTNAIWNFCDSTGDDLHVFKYDNTNSNNIRIELGGIAIANISSATYGPHWKVGEWNIFLVSSNGSSTNAWLNGVQVLVNDPTAWSPLGATTLYVASSGTNTNKFPGHIRNFKIFSQVLTGQEALDYYNNTTFNWRDRALVDLPMRMQDHDVPNLLTKNRGILGSAADAVFGDGSTPATYPTKLTYRRGYHFAASDSRLVIPDQAALRFNTEDFTLAAFVRPDYETSNAYIISKEDGTDDGWTFMHTGDPNYLRTKLDANIYTSGVDGEIIPGPLVTTIASFDRSANLIIAKNGINIYEADISAAGALDTSVGVTIGNRAYSFLNGFNGDIYQVFIFDWAVSQLQINDIHLQMLKGINDL